MTANLEDQFDAAMMDIYRRAKLEAKYNASRFFQMLADHRGLETARILLHAETVSEVYTALWERHRLDLTVEALIHDHREFHSLFTSEELAEAQRRLEKYEYTTTIDPVEPFIGALRTDVNDWSGNHDRYLGQAISNDAPGGPGQGS